MLFLLTTTLLIFHKFLHIAFSINTTLFLIIMYFEFLNYKLLRILLLFYFQIDGGSFALTLGKRNKKLQLQVHEQRHELHRDMAFKFIQTMLSLKNFCTSLW